MLRHLLQTGEIANTSEHNAVLTRALSETFSKLTPQRTITPVYEYLPQTMAHC